MKIRFPVPGVAERARLFAGHQAVLAQHQVQGHFRRRRRQRERVIAERPHAGEAVLRHHLEAPQGRCRPDCPGQMKVSACKVMVLKAKANLFDFLLPQFYKRTDQLAS